MTISPNPDLRTEARHTHDQSPWRRTLRVLNHSITAKVGLVVVAFYLLLTIVGPVLAPYDPVAQDLRGRLAPPNAAHWLGTDSLGRDILSRLLYGARLSTLSGLVTVAVALSLGIIAGTLAGYSGGWVDEIVMRVTDIFLAFPGLILAMAIAAILHPSLTNALIAIAVTWWPTYARLIRGQVLSVRGRDYVTAARSLGVTDLRVVLGHILPNCFGPVLVQATLDMGSIILTVAGLSFIGFGAQPPTPEWGVMVSEGRTFLQTQWWIATAPALAILILVMGFNLFGDGIRDVLDPRIRG